MNRWEAARADGNRYYGGNGTIHGTEHIDVVTDPDGTVIEVWFRCLPLPYRQTVRSSEKRGAPYPNYGVVGVELRDTPQQ